MKFCPTNSHITKSEKCDARATRTSKEFLSHQRVLSLCSLALQPAREDLGITPRKMPVKRQRRRYHGAGPHKCMEKPTPSGSEQQDLCGRTLMRSSRQGGLMDQLVPGNAPEHTVRRLWSATEDALLRSAIQKIGPCKWRTIAEHVPGRSHIQCMQRWHKVLEPTLNKGLWNAEEDEQLRAAVRIHGSSSWPAVAAIIPGRNCKQCRERWNNYLDPTLKKGCWEPAEDKALVKGQEMFGSRWSLLAKLLPGRSQIQVRDRCRVLGLKAKQAKKLAAQTVALATIQSARPAPATAPVPLRQAAVVAPSAMAATPPYVPSHSPTPSVVSSQSEPTSPPRLFAANTAAVNSVTIHPPTLAEPAAQAGAVELQPAFRGKNVMAQRAFAHVRGALAESALGTGIDVDASRGLLLLCAASYCSSKSALAHHV